MEEPQTYIPLHVHSCYSINDGLQNYGPIVKQAAKMHIPALALTDHNNMAGFIRFYSECIKNGIKPIMGADLQVFEKKVQGQEPRRFGLTVLAMDRDGKESLYELLSRAWLEVGSPDIDDAACTLEDLKTYSKGIIILDGFRGDIAALLSEKNFQEIEARIAFYLENFGDRFCFEITRTGREGESEFEKFALDACVKYGIPPVATNDTRFVGGPRDIPADGFSDYQIHDVRVSIQRGIPMGSEETRKIYSQEQYFRSPQEMAELFADIPEALINTRHVAERCNIKDNLIVEIDEARLPHYDTGSMSTDDKLREMAKEGLEERLKFLYPDEKVRAEKRPEYDERLKMELDTIIDLKFPGYFLIVQDFINWSKEHHVPVGPGRGSGGGSLVAYALRITDFDPLRFNLLFERFLNRERVSMPDFDVDFCQRNRYKTLQYVRDFYNAKAEPIYHEPAVSQIAAFGTLAAKAAIKGAGKALGMPYGQVDSVAKLIPDTPGTTFHDALGDGTDKNGKPLEPTSPEFRQFYDRAVSNDDRETLNLINISRRLEGVIRSIGKHAAGVVIAPTKLTDFSPLMLDSDGKPITQYDKKDVEHAGLVKFDFLGLATLTIIQDALDMINPRRIKEGKPELSTQDIPYEDAASYEMIQECETTAVFQLESTGMRQLIGKMKPDCFEDLVALVALYRPGPLESGMVDHFVMRKHGEEKICYPQEDFEELDLKWVLEPTYGVIVYQEQVMQIAQVLAGYSLGGADILRRAMGKKIPAEMAAQRGVFRKGCIEKGRDPEIDMKIFDQVEQFAKYGFNKSHSAAYALVAWWTLWLKVHYPAEFLAAMMTNDALNTEKLITYIAECHRLHIKVNPPDVNAGKFSFGVDDKGGVIYGFAAIKGIGEMLLKQAVEERESKGPFKDFFDFTARVYTDGHGKKLLSHGTLEALIKSGALDCFGEERSVLAASIDVALQYAQQKLNNQESGQFDLFGALEDECVKPELIKAKPWSSKIRLYHEMKLLGLYLSGHPIDPYREELRYYCGHTTLKNVIPGTYDRPNFVKLYGVVTNYVMRVSNKGNHDTFYFVTLDDSSMSQELALYGKNAEQFAAILANYDKTREARKNLPGDLGLPPPLILILDASVITTKEGVVRTQIRSVRSLEELRAHDARSITLRFSEESFEKNARFVDQTLQRNALRMDLVRQEIEAAGDERGIIKGCRLNLMIGNTLLRLDDRTFRYLPTEDLIDGLRDVIGPDAVTVAY